MADLNYTLLIPNNAKPTWFRDTYLKIDKIVQKRDSIKISYYKYGGVAQQVRAYGSYP